MVELSLEDKMAHNNIYPYKRCKKCNEVFPQYIPYIKQEIAPKKKLIFEDIFSWVGIVMLIGGGIWMLLEMFTSPVNISGDKKIGIVIVPFAISVLGYFVLRYSDKEQ